MLAPYRSILNTFVTKMSFFAESSRQMLSGRLTKWSELEKSDRLNVSLKDAFGCFRMVLCAHVRLGLNKFTFS